MKTEDAETIVGAMRLLEGHKCRVDSRKPAGGGVCNTCEAYTKLRYLLPKTKPEDFSMFLTWPGDRL